MFGLSFAEMLVIAVVLIVFVGPDKLPDLAKKIGKWSFHFRKNADSVRKEFYNSVFPPAAEIKNELRQLKEDFQTSKKDLIDSITKDGDKEQKNDK